jgi:putative protein kinase ArgK-like GTPase of G3E family
VQPRRALPAPRRTTRAPWPRDHAGREPSPNGTASSCAPLVAAWQTTPLVLGITGTGGAGKSSLIDELLRRFLLDFPQHRIAVLCVDPTRRKTGGALLGDRIRMNAAADARVFVRSMATRRANLALSESVQDALTVLKLAGFDLILLESSGIGQSDTEIVEHADVSLYVMTPEFGAQSQLEKIDMLDYADLVAINKFDRRGARDALRDVQEAVPAQQEGSSTAPSTRCRSTARWRRRSPTRAPTASTAPWRRRSTRTAPATSSARCAAGRRAARPRT